MSSRKEPFDWDAAGLMPAPVGDDPIEILMASINQPLPTHLSLGVEQAVAEAMGKLSERSRWVLDAVYIWGHSYSEIAGMMGYASKASAHGAVRTAQKQMKELLQYDHRIIRMMEGKVKMSDATWADASWRHLRSADRSATANNEFLPEMFDVHFRNMGACVQCLDTNKLVDICWSAGMEAARGLAVMGMWDIEQMQDILVSKQHDYGHGNINAFGIIGVAVRLSDKIARYNNLIGKPNMVAGETIVDTLMDMVGYAVIAKMLDDGTFQLDLEVEEPF
jgi:hypothetical protein